MSLPRKNKDMAAYVKLRSDVSEILEATESAFAVELDTIAQLASSAANMIYLEKDVTTDDIYRLEMSSKALGEAAERQSRIAGALRALHTVRSDVG